MTRGQMPCCHEAWGHPVRTTCARAALCMGASCNYAAWECHVINPHGYPLRSHAAWATTEE
eukprot:358965-Chlamydomonas_euryale.AAC.3